GVLQVLNDPKPSAGVEFDADRLAHHRLGGDELDHEPVGDAHLRRRYFRGIALSMPDFRPRHQKETDQAVKHRDLSLPWSHGFLPSTICLGRFQTAQETRLALSSGEPKIALSSI